MRAPEFWSAPVGLAASVLTPLGCLYAAAGRIRRWAMSAQQVDIPVICVGNLVAGGAGKTPVALALAERLTSRHGLGSVHCLTRGYGGSASGPLRVDPLRHDASQVGDEALLLAAVAPCWVARDRVAGAQAARAAGAACLILDDGFQNPALHKDLSLLVIDGPYGFGNGRVMPAGPLREPLSDALARADGVVIIGEDRHDLAGRLNAIPVLRARLAASAESAAAVAGRRVLAFAGIGRPDKFFESLGDLKCQIAATRAFPDHHPYRPSEIAELLAQAASLDAMPVTTAKDAMRLPNDIRGRVTVLDVALIWDDHSALDKLLAERLTISPT